MSTVLWTAIAIAALLVSVYAHEGAHAIAMTRLGIKVAELGFGFMVGPRLTFRPRRLPFALALSPVPVGAWVKPHVPEPPPGSGLGAQVKAADPVGELPYRDMAWVSGAGIVVNLIIACAAAAAWGLVTPPHTAGAYLTAAAWAAGGAVIWVFRRAVTRYVLPALAFPLLGLEIWGIVLTLAAHQAGGPAGAVADMVSHSGSQALLAVALINIALAAFNAIPVWPMDGGRIFIGVLAAWRGRDSALVLGAKLAGTVAFAAIVAFAVGSDLLHYI